MKMRLPEERQYLVIENTGLIGKIISGKFKTYSHIYDDLFSIGKIGLVKAAITFDPEKGIKFSTYAATCITNEIGMFLRKQGKYEWTLSLDETFDEEGKLSLGDTIVDPKSDFYTEIESEEEDLDNIKRILEFVLNELDGKKRQTMLYFMAGVKQHKIEQKVKVSQSYVSKIENRVIKYIKENLETNPNKHQGGFFTVKVSSRKYQIAFFTKDTTNLKKAIATFLQNINSNQYVPKFEMSYDRGRFSITIFDGIECLEFFADIIQQMDNFEISTKPYVEDKVIEKIISAKADDKGEQIPLQEHKKAGKGRKVEGKATQIREYFMKKQEFTRAEIIEAFPDFKTGDIGNAITTAKKEGLIVPIGRGKYAVKK